MQKRNQMCMRTEKLVSDLKSAFPKLHVYADLKNNEKHMNGTKFKCRPHIESVKGGRRDTKQKPTPTTQNFQNSHNNTTLDLHEIVHSTHTLGNEIQTNQTRKHNPQSIHMLNTMKKREGGGISTKTSPP